MILWHNGHLQDANAPVLPLGDRGLRYGDGVFDTLLVTQGTPIEAKAHFARLMRHAGVLRLPVPITQENWRAAVQDLLAANIAQKGPWVLNTYITRGLGERGLMPPESFVPSVILALSATPKSLPTLVSIIARTTRRLSLSPLSRIKAMASYGDNVLALMEARDKGVHEAILLNENGYAACTSMGNLIAQKDGQRFTPPLSDGAIDGITRGLLIAQGTLHERRLTESDLRTADSLYMCNSVRGVVEITLI